MATVFWPLQVSPGALALVEAPEEATSRADASDSVPSQPSGPRSRLHSLPPLTSVAVVCRLDPRISALPHIVSLVSAFLDTTEHWSLLEACTRARSICLLRRIHALEQCAVPPLDAFYRDWLFNQCVDQAARDGALDVVKWLATEYSPGNLVLIGARIAAVNGHLDVLRWLVEDYGCVFRSKRELSVALKNGHLDVVKWLLPMWAPDYRRFSVAEWGAISNNFLFDESMYKTASLEFLQWVAAECGTERMDRGLKPAVYMNRLPVVQWLAQYLDALYCEREAPNNASSSFSSIVFPVRLAVTPYAGAVTMECVKWLYEQQYCWIKMSVTPFTMDTLAAQGRLDDFKWFHTNLGGLCSVNAVNYAAAQGHLDIAQWLYANALGAVGTSRVFVPDWDRQRLYTGAPVSDVAANGHLDVLRWLHDNVREGWSTAAMDAAAGHGQLQVVRWLHEVRREGCSRAAMDSAAENGHLEVVKWLHANRTEGCTVGAMDRAALNGHLETVKWLHAHRTEGCTAGAVEYAVASNRVEIVQWLLENRRETATRGLIDIAAAQGHLALVRWLSLHAPSPANECSVTAMNLAAMNGHLAVVEWLHENRREGCTTIAMDGAAARGHFDVLLFLFANRSEGITMSAFAGAFRTNRLEILRWLVYNFPLAYSPQGLLGTRGTYYEGFMRRWVADEGLVLGERLAPSAAKRRRSSRDAASG